MFEPRCEMSYGDQAALIGVLELVRPSVSIEVGTYEGGSLALIAPRSSEVHTFDLASHVDTTMPNVHYHLGDSRVKLPRQLQSIQSQGKKVGFVLIDGDHERSAVAADLSAVLDSPAVERALVLLHDAANEDVRAGIRDAGLKRPEVVHVDLSFTVPAKRLRPWNEGWGGFALIVVDRVGDFWPHGPGIDESQRWRTSVPQRLGWHALTPVRSGKRRAGYAMRPAYRKFRGTRGVQLDE